MSYAASIPSLTKYLSGGTLLTTLLSTQHDVIKAATISVLVRGKDKASVLESKGVRTILFEGFDDSEVIKKAASEHDCKICHTIQELFDVEQ